MLGAQLTLADLPGFDGQDKLSSLAYQPSRRLLAAPLSLARRPLRVRLQRNLCLPVGAALQRAPASGGGAPHREPLLAGATPTPSPARCATRADETRLFSATAGAAHACDANVCRVSDLPHLQPSVLTLSLPTLHACAPVPATGSTLHL